MLRGSRVRNGVEGEGGGGISVADPLLNGYKLASFAYGPGEHWCQPVVTRVSPPISSALIILIILHNQA
jgi:hypothetical protein